MSQMPRHRVLSLLAECTGDDIWSVEHCRARKLPEAWIAEMSDAFESSFLSDSETIYTDIGITNQYHGIRDVDLAIALAGELNVHVPTDAIARYGRRRLVQAIKDAVVSGEDQL